MHIHVHVHVHVHIVYSTPSLSLHTIPQSVVLQELLSFLSFDCHHDVLSQVMLMPPVRKGVLWLKRPTTSYSHAHLVQTRAQVTCRMLVRRMHGANKIQVYHYPHAISDFRFSWPWPCILLLTAHIFDQTNDYPPQLSIKFTDLHNTDFNSFVWWSSMLMGSC